MFIVQQNIKTLDVMTYTSTGIYHIISYIIV